VCWCMDSPESGSKHSEMARDSDMSMLQMSAYRANHLQLRHRWAAVLGMTIIGLAPMSGCTTAPTTITECADVSDATQREDCYLDVASTLKDNRADLSAAVREIPNRNSRDLLRLRLAVLDPVKLGWICNGAEGKHAIQRCENIVHRPHLMKPPPKRMKPAPNPNQKKPEAK